jgi:hypothetical protein
MIAVPVILSFASLLSVFFMAVIVKAAVEHELPQKQRVALAAFGCGIIVTMFELLCFMVTWIPFDTAHCVGMLACSAQSSVEHVIDGRWTFATVAAISAAFAYGAYLVGVKGTRKSTRANI